MQFENLDEFSEEFDDFECPEEGVYSEGETDIVVDGEVSHEFILLPEINEMAALISVTDIFGNTTLFCDTVDALRAFKSYLDAIISSLEEMKEDTDGFDEDG